MTAARRLSACPSILRTLVAASVLAGMGLIAVAADAAAPGWRSRGNTATISDGQGTLAFTCAYDAGGPGGAFEIELRDPALASHRDHVRLSLYVDPPHGTREKHSVLMNIVSPDTARYEAPLREAGGNLNPLLRALQTGQRFGMTMERYTGEDLQGGRIFSLRGSRAAIAGAVKRCGQPAPPPRRR